MYCLECDKLINKRIVYFNIFKKNIHKVCETCFMTFNINYQYEVLPLNNYLLHLNIIVNDFENPYSIMSFLKPYYIYYLKNKLKMLILYFDILDRKMYNLVTKTNISNIYMIVLKNKIEKRNGYEDWNYWEEWICSIRSD